MKNSPFALRALAGVGLALLLAACAPSSSTTSSPSSSSFPVTLTHKYGTTTLTQAPQRVVTLGLVDQDAFVALGVVPVATREWYGKVPGALFPWAKAKIGDAPLPEVLAYELDFEKIASFNPDVIVGLYSGLTQEEYDTLSKIAPTVAQPAGLADWAADWRVITTTAGAILGKSDVAQPLIQALDEKVASVRQAHPEFAQRTAVLLSDYGWPATFWTYSYNGGLQRFFTDLGFQPSPSVKEVAGEGGVALSREKFDLVDADLVLWNLGSDEAEKALKADSVWSKSRAVREGRVLYYRTGQGTAYDALVFASVLSLASVVDGLAADWAATSDGDPSTLAPSLESK